MLLSSRLLVLAAVLISGSSHAQQNLLYERLPVGQYPVGFRIFTFTDESRLSLPAFNYLGEKNEGDRRRKITIHLWYPSQRIAGKAVLSFADYCFNDRLETPGQVISDSAINEAIAARRRSVENWFGKTTDEAWQKLMSAGMLAQKDAEWSGEKFPLLIGTLRSLSTSMTNEVLASNGYIVAMVKDESSASFADAALDNIQDMRLTMLQLSKMGIINEHIGTFGFSGSGFSQVLFGMSDYRLQAVADIESGIYMEGLYQGISASNYYHPEKLAIPFLHIFSKDLSAQEKYIDDFKQKTRFTKRYRLILNQPKLHHWDFACEGYTSCFFLNNRGAEQDKIRQSFEIATEYLLNFFNAELKADPKAKQFFAQKPVLSQHPSSLWNITAYESVAHAPDIDELEALIRKKGIDEAMKITAARIVQDSTTNIMQSFRLNRLGYEFMNERKYSEAIPIFKLNTTLHPDDANLFDSLAEAYERTGDQQETKHCSEKVMVLLNGKTALTDAEKGLKENAEKRLKL